MQEAAPLNKVAEFHRTFKHPILNTPGIPTGKRCDLRVSLLLEEMKELQEAVEENNPMEQEQEFGDVLFSLVNYARFLSIDAETALERTNRKFIRRFTKMEEAVELSGKKMTDLSLADLDAIWEEVKKQNQTD